MANKKKIEERLKAQQEAKTERTIRWVGGGVVIVFLVLVVWLLTPGESSNVIELPTSVPTLVEAPLDEPAAPPQSEPQTSIQRYDAYPPMTIDTSKKYTATFKMAKGGDFTVELYADKAPITVNSFVFLAREGFYDGITFHRVIDGFMAQGGDPTGTGGGGPGYQFEDEFSPDLRFDGPGILAMANAGPGTNGSQFFITFAATEWLNDMHTIFGKVVEGMDVVNSITRRDPGSPTPGDVIETIVITEE